MRTWIVKDPYFPEWLLSAGVALATAAALLELHFLWLGTSGGMLDQKFTAHCLTDRREW